jgi:hypothetical protein
MVEDLTYERYLFLRRAAGKPAGNDFKREFWNQFDSEWWRGWISDLEEDMVQFQSGELNNSGWGSW